MGKWPSQVCVHCEGCGASPLQPAVDSLRLRAMINCFLIVLSAGRSLGTKRMLLQEVHGGWGMITAKT